MSEYWVSKKKYYCKYCDVYIADDAPSRNQHEGGMRHQGNKERYVRNLYKTAERKKKDDEEEAREMKRIEAVAQAAYAVDVGAGRGGGPSIPGPSTTRSTAPTKLAKTAASYTTAADLGIVDEDEVKRAAEAAVRQNEGRIGAWEAIAPSAAQPSNPASVPSKRPAERDSRTYDDEDDTRAFQVKKRKLAAGLGDIYDPGVITVRPKGQPQPKDSTTVWAEAPRWAPVSLTGSAHRDEVKDDAEVDRLHSAIDESQVDQVQLSTEAAVDPAPLEAAKVKPKLEDATHVIPPAPSLFRKRRGPSATASKTPRDS
ncbi:hypothetical protein BKA62DRAFT_667159 [Auriculariales sp. MPI-PUGE-AT-0066]|nr:hypothetical protein BKA62DRAFT_667159 [Auriculariales sp. MPI-PUGE-AT-0066]